MLERLPIYFIHVYNAQIVGFQNHRIVTLSVGHVGCYELSWHADTEAQSCETERSLTSVAALTIEGSASAHDKRLGDYYTLGLTSIAYISARTGQR
jgi:hypothetical protein